MPASNDVVIGSGTPMRGHGTDMQQDTVPTTTRFRERRCRSADEPPPDTVYRTGGCASNTLKVRYPIEPEGDPVLWR